MLALSFAITRQTGNESNFVVETLEESKDSPLVHHHGKLQAPSPTEGYNTRESNYSVGPKDGERERQLQM